MKNKCICTKAELELYGSHDPLCPQVFVLRQARPQEPSQAWQTFWMFMALGLFGLGLKLFGIW